jgi:beta-keto acid cleavage enzyme
MENGRWQNNRVLPFAMCDLPFRIPETVARHRIPRLFSLSLPRLEAGCNAAINVTTGGGLNMTVDDRLKGPVMLRPEMCSLNMGSMNFAIYPLADRDQSWKYDWEEPYLRFALPGPSLSQWRDTKLRPAPPAVFNGGKRSPVDNPDILHRL